MKTAQMPSESLSAKALKVLGRDTVLKMSKATESFYQNIADNTDAQYKKELHFFR